MRRFAPLALAIWMPCSTPLAAATPAEGRAREEGELREIKEVLWPRAYREGDTKLLDRILAAEFQMIDGDGVWSTKREELDYVASHRPSYLSFRFEIQRLEIFENGTAVVAGRGVVEMPVAAESYEYQSSNILIRRDGRWQAIASHVSGVKPRSGDDSLAPR